ncbi:unnamed protein product [Phytophthora fragariaefolia]|uniref:Unnamed protein product n=1 Tax=Phytophthora fragariaefolia TaxID=1490495 RepID=A0A9W7CNI0_9STRA|nr:unnamed protein product [Phytophthora fragariaefolia]
MNFSLEEAMVMEDDDAKALEEALSFLEECETSTEWLMGANASLNLTDVGLDDHIGELDAGLELPTLTEQPIAKSKCASMRHGVSANLSMEVVSCLEMGHLSSSSPSSGSPNSFTSSPTVQPQNPKGKKPKQPRKYSNRARDARREELVYLRQKVKDLQVQLDQLLNTHKPQTASAPFSSVAAPPSTAELKNAKGKNRLTAVRTTNLSTGTPSATFSSVAAPMASTASPAHLAAVWGDMAQRQAQERQKAERENVRLKLVLEKQIKMAKSLERILLKRQNERVKYPNAS